MSAALAPGHLPELSRRGIGPGYDPQNHAAGILHIGCGAFFRAHLAACTNAALARGGGNWRIVAANLRSRGDIDALNAQGGLYTLLERSKEGAAVKVIASISHAIAATDHRDRLLQALADPAIRIVSLTVTEKAYGIDRGALDIDPAHASVAADLAHPEEPAGVLGYLVQGLALRRKAGHAPPTILCCDNLPQNGKLLRAGVLGFARRVDPDLADYIARSVAFPSTMVDRITPASTDQTRRDALQLTGLQDEAAVETEPFFQWVIEDNFPTGRPQWEAGGAVFVSDVEPYEDMKLRMLNGAHSMLAYGGFLSGHKYVRDVMADPALSRLVARHLRAAAATLKPLDGIDLGDYAAQLIARFSNPAIAHETYQIAMDGTQKIAQRLASPAAHALQAGQDIRPFAFAVALWMRYCTGATDDGAPYDLRDPQSGRIAAIAAASQGNPKALVSGLMKIGGAFPAALSQSPDFQSAVLDCLKGLLDHGVAAAIRKEAAL